MEKEIISEGTSARKREGMRWAPHQRLWWTELVRGLIAFAFGLLFLMARSFAPRLFMYSLGMYLVIDGLLELSDVHRRKGFLQTRTFDSVGGVISFLTGLFSLIFPAVSLLLLAGILAVRLFIRSLSQMQAAWRTHDSSSLLLWFSSSLFVALGLFLLLFPLLAMTFLVIFLGSYMVGAGLFLLLRGLSLRFRPNSLSTSVPPLPQALPDLSKDLPSSTRRALVFVRRTAADGLGHIAWGFEWKNGWFNVGSVENSKGNPFADPAEMGFWSTQTQDHPEAELSLR